MDDTWGEEGKAKDLIIPGMALPGLRDLKVLFVALIEFDLFMGPVVHLNEISRGSSYIKKLRDYQTLSEVYAGVARSDVDTLTTIEDVIAVFRYHPDGNEDITTVFMISCIAGSNMEDIRKIGSSALFRSKGDPMKIGAELSISLRELHLGEPEFKRSLSDTKITIMVEDRIKKPVDLSFIDGFALIDLESNLADFRLFPSWYMGKELNPNKLLLFLDNQFNSIEAGTTTSLLYQSMILMMTRVKQLEIFFVLLISESDILKIEKIGKWINDCTSVISSEWRFSSLNEILKTLEIFNLADSWYTPTEFLKIYIRMAMRCERIKPIATELDPKTLSKPSYFKDKTWELLSSFDGTKSINSISYETNTTVFDLIRMLQWAKVRNLIMFLQE